MTDATTTTDPLPPVAAPERPVVVMLLYPGLTLLDLVGPHTTFAPFMDVHLVAKTLDGVISDGGVTIQPTKTLADAPVDVDVLFVPGGAGTAGAMEDVETLAFLADRASRARYVSAVCTGSLVLGAAGLLQGYRAGSHWSTRHLLPLFGAEASDDRVVIDRNRVTGGGVTAGIDFGLTLVAEMLGEDAAKLCQLMMEYDPQPPFTSGSPTTADPHHIQFARSVTQAMDDAAGRAARHHHPAGR